jgi:hypothetical protein
MLTDVQLSTTNVLIYSDLLLLIILYGKIYTSGIIIPVEINPDAQFLKCHFPLKVVGKKAIIYSLFHCKRKTKEKWDW